MVYLHVDCKRNFQLLPFMVPIFPISGVRLTRTFKNRTKKNHVFIHEKNAIIDENLKVSTHFLIKHECKIMYAHFHGRCIYISLDFYHFP